MLDKKIYKSQYIVERINPNLEIYHTDDKGGFDTFISLTLRNVETSATTGFVLLPKNEHLFLDCFGCKNLEELIGKEITRISFGDVDSPIAIGCNDRYVTNAKVYDYGIFAEQEFLTEQELLKSHSSRKR